VRGERNIKKGLFQVVEAEIAEGLIEPAVPEASVQLVRRRLAEDHWLAPELPIGVRSGNMCDLQDY